MWNQYPQSRFFVISISAERLVPPEFFSGYSGTNLLHVKERKQFTTNYHSSRTISAAEQISYMSKNESNSQPNDWLEQISGERNKSLTCQRTKAIHNHRPPLYSQNPSGTNLLHVKERKQFTTVANILKFYRQAEQISYMSKNESNSQRRVLIYRVVDKRNKSLTCQRTKAIHNWSGENLPSCSSGTNLLHVKERKQFTT